MTYFHTGVSSNRSPYHRYISVPALAIATLPGRANAGAPLLYYEHDYQETGSRQHHRR